MSQETSYRALARQWKEPLSDAQRDELDRVLQEDYESSQTLKIKLEAMTRQRDILLNAVGKAKRMTDFPDREPEADESISFVLALRKRLSNTWVVLAEATQTCIDENDKYWSPADGNAD